MKIDIIGGGIGGLTTALALKQKGIEVTIYEQTSELKTVGAGIILANNAMQVYQHLGIANELLSLGNPLASMHITRPDLSSLSSVYLSAFEEKYGICNIAIHRSDLQKTLLSKLDASQINLSKKLVGINKRIENKNTLLFEDGSNLQPDVIIGADGIHSVVRESLDIKTKIRKAKQVCWRGVVNFILPEKYRHKFQEAWGKGSRFGFGQINDKQVYWFALLNYKNSIREYDGDDWKKSFNNYHPIIKELLQVTFNHQIFLDEITDLQWLNQWYKGNICLIGDAAHAMTPNMGQGAGQAIEDAWVLANCLNKNHPPYSFELFQKMRMAKVKKIMEASWSIGKIAQLENRFGIKIRNMLMYMTPLKVTKKQMGFLFDIQNDNFG